MRTAIWHRPALRSRWMISAIVLGGAISAASAAEPSPQAAEAWRTSPFHGVIDGATGKPIPCLCRFRDRHYHLGEKVCLQTQYGTVFARCDLAQNNTSWVPTDEPCEISFRAPQTPVPPLRKS